MNEPGKTAEEAAAQAEVAAVAVELDALRGRLVRVRSSGDAGEDEGRRCWRERDQPMKPKRLEIEAKKETERARAMLRRFLARAGVTQSELAHRVGLTQGSLSQLLRVEGTALRFHRLLQILDAIAVEPRTFFAELYDLSAADLEARLDALVGAVLQKGLLTRDELREALTSESPAGDDKPSPDDLKGGIN